MATRTIGSGGGYATIQLAVNAAVAGDILSIIEAKTYSEQVTLQSSGSSGNVITLRNDSGGTVIISSTSSPVLDTNVKSYWTFLGFTVTYVGVGSGPICIGHSLSTAANGLTFTNISVIGNGGSGDSFGWSISNYTGVTLTNCSFLASSGGTWDGMDFIRATTIRVTGGTISATDPTKLDDGIVIQGTDSIIDGVTLSEGQGADPAHPDGIVIQGDGTVGGATHIIRNCRITNFTQCVYIDAINSDVTGVQVYNNILRQDAVTWVHAGSVNGIILDGENVGGSATYKCGVLAYNNTIDVRGTTIRATRQISTAAGNTKEFKNNLFVNPGFTAVYFDSATNIANVALNYNFYDSAGDATVTNWSGSNVNLAGLQAAGQEANGQRNTPGIIGSGNYQASGPTSGIVGVGLNLASVFTTDITGDTRVAPWDVGAYQYDVTTGTLNATTVNFATMVVG